MKIALAMLLLALAGCSQQPHDSIKEQTREVVLLRLKSPSTATIGPVTVKHHPEIEETIWIASGWVDAQNGFGAMIRNRYEMYYSCENGKVIFVSDDWLKK